jgi:hypothetical protein
VRANRDSFTQLVRNYVAGEVQYLCSFPACGAPTIGPSVAPGRLTSVGVAAHITAASRGGPRYDERLTPEQRSSADNAIWMCQTHAKVIDDDTETYTAELLRDWKRAAVARAERALKAGTIDPDGRRRLQLEYEQTLVRRVLRATIDGRAAILRGTAISREASVAVDTERWRAVLNSSQDWLERLSTVATTMHDLLIDVRVEFGPDAEAGDPLIKLYLWTVTWGDWFRENLLILIGHQTHHARVCNEEWNWDAVFRGEAEHRTKLVGALDTLVQRVEAWAGGALAGTRQPD